MVYISKHGVTGWCRVNLEDLDDDLQARVEALNRGHLHNREQIEALTEAAAEAEGNQT